MYPHAYMDINCIQYWTDGTFKYSRPRVESKVMGTVSLKYKLLDAATKMSPMGAHIPILLALLIRGNKVTTVAQGTTNITYCAYYYSRPVLHDFTHEWCLLHATRYIINQECIQLCT